MCRIGDFNVKHSSPETISMETLKHSVIANDFLTEAKYDLIYEIKPYLINRFCSIGFVDPYPDDDKFITGSVDDLPDDFKQASGFSDRVYPDSRYTPGNSPYCIYIPNKEIMLKLMRACIRVKKIENLWINKHVP